MRICLIHSLIVLEIGGGFLGVWTTVSMSRIARNMSHNYWILNIPAILLFLFGIGAGLALVQRPRLGIVLSGVYQALQIPALLSPLLCYKLQSGLLIGVVWSQGKVGPWIEFGSTFGFQVFGFKGSALIGINLLALALFVFILLELPRINRSDKKPSK